MLKPTSMVYCGPASGSVRRRYSTLQWWASAWRTHLRTLRAHMDAIIVHFRAYFIWLHPWGKPLHVHLITFARPHLNIHIHLSPVAMNAITCHARWKKAAFVPLLFNGFQAGCVGFLPASTSKGTSVGCTASGITAQWLSSFCTTLCTHGTTLSCK